MLQRLMHRLQHTQRPRHSYRHPAHATETPAPLTTHTATTTLVRPTCARYSLLHRLQHTQRPRYSYGRPAHATASCTAYNTLNDHDTRTTDLRTLQPPAPPTTHSTTTILVRPICARYSLLHRLQHTQRPRHSYGRPAHATASCTAYNTLNDHDTRTADMRTLQPPAPPTTHSTTTTLVRPTCARYSLLHRLQHTQRPRHSYDRPAHATASCTAYNTLNDHDTRTTDLRTLQPPAPPTTHSTTTILVRPTCARYSLLHRLQHTQRPRYSYGRHAHATASCTAHNTLNDHDTRTLHCVLVRQSGYI